jgi:hypothetical protein
MPKLLKFLPDSKTGRKTVVLNAPAMAILAELPRIGAFAIAGESGDAEESSAPISSDHGWRCATRQPCRCAAA